jgi:hypothetical protein
MQHPYIIPFSTRPNQTNYPFPPLSPPPLPPPATATPPPAESFGAIHQILASLDDLVLFESRALHLWRIALARRLYNILVGRRD